MLYYVEKTAVSRPTCLDNWRINMISRRIFILGFITVLALSLVLAGCVRPIPDNEATPVPAEPDTSDPNVGGGTGFDPTQAAPQPTEVVAGYPVEASTAVSEEVAAYPGEGATAVPSAVETISPTEAPGEQEPVETVTPEPAAPDPTTAPAETSAEDTTAASSGCPKTHVVQPGENLFRVGLQYGLSWVVLAQYNGITNPNNITAGQTIQIPCEGATPPPVTPPTTPPADGVVYYTVQPGDNLFRIGLKFGVSWVEIAEANGLVNPNQIYAGQTLKIPTSAPGPRPEFTHVVKQGETIYSISVQYGVSAAAIAEANHLQSPYIIYPGQTLLIPGVA
jgi:LysM repeat protein